MPGRKWQIACCARPAATSLLCWRKCPERKKRHNSALIALGSKLYADPRLSKTIPSPVRAATRWTICVLAWITCLDPLERKVHWGAEIHRPLERGLAVRFFLGRPGKDLADQAGQPILNPIEMGMPDQQSVIDKLAGLEEYQSAFREAYPESENPITYAHLTRAIAAFERTLRSESDSMIFCVEILKH